MKLLTLKDFIDNIQEQVDNDELSKSDAYDLIREHNLLLQIYLRKNMFISEPGFSSQCIFKGKFELGSCWDAGYDNYVDGDFIKHDDSLFNIKNQTFADMIDFFKNVELNDHGIKLIYGQREFNLRQLLNK